MQLSKREFECYLKLLIKAQINVAFSFILTIKTQSNMHMELKFPSQNLFLAVPIMFNAHA